MDWFPIIMGCLAVISAVLIWTCRLHHLSIYTGSFSASSTDSDLPAAADPAVTLVNSHPIFPVPIQAIMAYGFGAATLNRLRLSTPKLRAINVPYLRPLDIATAPTSRTPLVEWFHHPLSLNPIDENQILITQSAAVATQFFAGVWFGDGNWNVPQGDLFTIRATATITLTANAWQGGAAITLDQPLPAGIYSVVGMDCWATNLAFARLVFPNQVWRPGIVAGAAESFIVSRYFRWGNLGEFGRFATFALPQLDTFATTAGSQAVQLFLDIVRIQ